MCACVCVVGGGRGEGGLMYLYNSYHGGYCKNSLISDMNMINMDCIICIVTDGDVWVPVGLCMCQYVLVCVCWGGC